MKKAFLSICLLISALLSYSADGLEENFDDNTLTGWTAHQAYYTLTEANQELKVEASTETGAYHGFIFNFPEPLDLTLVPYVKVRIKTSRACSVRIDLQDNNGWVTNQTAVVKQIPGNNTYSEYIFNFGGLFYQQYAATQPGQGVVDQANIANLIVMINAGQAAYNGTVYFDDVQIGSATGITPPPGKIVLNQAGFYPDANKIAIVEDSTSGPFYIIRDADEDTVYTGELGPIESWTHSPLVVRKADFSEFSETGKYRVLVPALEQPSPAFEIKEEVHNAALHGSLKSYYYQRASIELESAYAGKWARAAGHPDTRVLVHESAASVSRPAGTTIETPYGWYDAGDYGKYIVNSGIATYQLLALYEHFPSFFDTLVLNIPESDNNIPDILDECLWNLRWMLSMQDEDGGVYHKNTSLRHDGNIMPHASSSSRYVIGKSTAASLDFAAVMAQASRIFHKYDEALAKSMYTAAIRAYDWAIENPEQIFTNPSGVNTGEYGDRNVADEFVWARAELLISSYGDLKYYNSSDFSQNASIPGWQDVRTLGLVSLSNYRKYIPAIWSDSTTIKNRLLNTANQFVSTYNRSAYGVVMGHENWNFTWGSNAVAGNQGMILIQAYRITQNQNYLDAALSNLDYLLGRNATGYSFLTGFGEKSPLDPHHRPSYVDGIAEPVPGLMMGGPHANSVAGEQCPDYPGSSRADRYADHWCSYSTNENAINYNSAFTYLAGAIEALRLNADFQLPVGFGKDQSRQQLTVLIYPNPATEKLFIQYAGSEKASITLSNLQGIPHLHTDLPLANEVEIDIRTLPKGMYIMTFQTPSASYSEKVIVK